MYVSFRNRLPEIIAVPISPIDDRPPRGTLDAARGAPPPPRRSPCGRTVLLALVACLALPPAFSGALAHEPLEPPQDVFSFAVSSEAEIDNDLMRATLTVQGEADEPAALAEQINTTMGWALDALGAHERIRRETRDYSTWPRYDAGERRRLIGWRASQTLELESEDFAAMGEAIATLQERLQVQSTLLAVRPETRRRASDALIEEALAAFRARAELVRASFGASGYRVLEVDVQSEEGGGGGMMRSRVMAMESADTSVSEPGIAAGSSRVTVRVHGRIRLDGMP